MTLGIKYRAVSLLTIGMSLILLFTFRIIPSGLKSISAEGSENSIKEISRSLETLSKGWNKIPGGSGTSCSAGAPYFYFVRLGNPRQLLIHFQGGGACWNNINCDLKRRPTYDPTVDDDDQPKQVGVFDFANPENPFKDFTVVFVPYCTADVHLGNRLVTYSDPPDNSGRVSTFQIHHEGYPNAMAAVSWAFANILSPKIVFVSGVSAGAIASPFFAAVVAERYKKSRIIQLGDGAGGYRTPTVTKLLENWGALDVIRRTPPYLKEQGPINFETLYTVAARNLPSLKFSQFNTVEDDTQLSFLRLIGVEGVSLEQLIEQNYADIRKTYPSFRTFTAPGKTHTVLSRPEFYTLRVNGIRVRDWVADMLRGKSVEDVKKKD
jgi:hypothetical protein